MKNNILFVRPEIVCNIEYNTLNLSISHVTPEVIRYIEKKLSDKLIGMPLNKNTENYCKFYLTNLLEKLMVEEKIRYDYENKVWGLDAWSKIINEAPNE